MRGTAAAQARRRVFRPGGRLHHSTSELDARALRQLNLLVRSGCCEAVKKSIHRLADLSPSEGVWVKRVVQDQSITDREQQRCQRVGWKVDRQFTCDNGLVDPRSEH